MPIVLPAIIAESAEEIREKVDAVRGLVDWVQVDIVDGEFAPATSWPFTGGDPAELQDIALDMNIELHLMTKKPERMIESWLESGAKRILLHYESTPNIDELLMIIDGSNGVDAGIALLMDTPIEAAYPFLDRIRHVQLMSIAEIGSYGNPFDEGVLEKIATLRGAYPDVTIAVDGGVTLETAPQLVAAGADALVAGSAIWKSGDIAMAIDALKSI